MDKIVKIKQLTNELLQYCYEYYVLDNPTISDIEYDKKFDELLKLENEANFWISNSPTRKVQGEVLPYLAKVRHSVPMLSADKSTDIEDVKKFINGKMVLVSYKLDGSTVVLKYNNHKLVQALSRGSGYDGEDITHTARMIKNIPETIPYEGYLEIRGEALIPWQYYNEMNKDGTLGHPRNVASGGLRQLDANEAAKRNIYFYAFTLVNWKDIDIMPMKSSSLMFLRNNGFDTVPYYCVPACDSKGDYLQSVLDKLDRKTYSNPTDGWCIEFENLSYGDSLGSTEHHDKRLYALKPELEEHTTIFRGVEYQTCRTGVVSLKAIFDTVEIGNTNVSKATLHNIDFFNALELGTNDEIVISKMNEIVPGILDNNTRSGTYKLIDTCPTCGEKLIIKNTGTANVLYCPNENCESRILNKFVYFASKNAMNIEGLSKATLSLLIDNDYLHTFKDIYHLSEHDTELAKLPGLGKKSVEKLLDSIEKSRNVHLENFICALGINGIGISASKTIAKYFDYDVEKFMNAELGRAYGKPFDWTKLDDFGEVMAKNMGEYMWENKESVLALAAEMNFIVPEKKQVADNPFVGKVLVVTGKLTHFTRDSINEKIASLGAKTAGSVSKKTDYLITNEASGSSKYKKAVELGIPVISEDEFLKMINE